MPINSHDALRSKHHAVQKPCSRNRNFPHHFRSQTRLPAGATPLAAGVAAVVVIAAAPVVVAAAAEQEEQDNQYNNPAAVVVTIKASTVHKSSTP